MKTLVILFISSYISMTTFDVAVYIIKMPKINMVFYQKIIICSILTFIFVFIKKEGKAFEVPDLSERNFNKTITENDFVLIMYYTFRCSPCDKLLLDFAYAGGQAIANTPAVLFAKVNCAELLSEKLCYKVTEIPVLKFYKFGRYVDDFNHKGRDDMASFARKFVSPTSEEILSKEHFLDYLESTTYAVIGVFQKPCKLKDAYTNITNLMYERFDYAHTYNNEVMDYLSIKQGIIVYKPSYMRSEFEEDFSVYNGEPDMNKIQHFILRNYHGLVGFRRPENRNEFSLPILIVFYNFNFKDDIVKSKEIRTVLLEVAVQYRKYLNFAISRTNDWTGLLKKFGLRHPDGKTPITTVMDASERKYLMENEFNRKSLKEFVRKFIDKSLVPFVRSAPISDKKDGLIFEVVARNLEEVVMDSQRDAILYIYNPDCSVCQRMDGEYRSLAEELKDEDIILCKINGIVNDLPRLVKPNSFPTIFFLQKNKKHKPVTYYSGPDFHKLLVFVSRYSTEELKNFDREGNKKVRRVEL